MIKVGSPTAPRHRASGVMAQYPNVIAALWWPRYVCTRLTSMPPRVAYTWDRGHALEVTFAATAMPRPPGIAGAADKRA